MTVTSTTSRRVHDGNGSATSFSFDFPITASGDLVVTLTAADGTESVLQQDSDYAVSVPAYPGAGAVQYPLSGLPLPEGARLTLERRLPIDQQIDLQNQGNFYAETHEGFFDKAIMICQQLADALGRAPKLPASSTLSELFFPLPGANRVLVWNDSATGLANGPTASDVASAQGHALAAGAARTAAEAARDKAERWADEDEDQEVEPGRHSARHHAAKAAGSAAEAAGLVAGLNLPTIQPGDAGKLLAVNEAETGYRLEAPDAGFRPGDTKETFRSDLEPGWLWCDGSAVSRTTYADLFAAIGTTYGAGNGSTTFSLPDARQRMTIARGDGVTRVTEGVSGIDGTALGATGGDQRRPAHSHTSPPHGHSSSGHTHGTKVTSISQSTRTVASGSGVSVVDDIVANTNNPSVAVTISNATVTINADGAGTAENIPPAIVVNRMVKY